MRKWRDQYGPKNQETYQTSQAENTPRTWEPRLPLAYRRAAAARFPLLRCTSTSRAPLLRASLAHGVPAGEATLSDPRRRFGDRRRSRLAVRLRSKFGKLYVRVAAKGSHCWFVGRAHAKRPEPPLRKSRQLSVQLSTAETGEPEKEMATWIAEPRL